MKRQNIKFVKSKSAPQPGYIYVISAVGTNKFKIGRTRDVMHRINQLQTGCPLKIRYVYHIYVSDTSSIETELHHRFFPQREIGEWFTLTSSQVKDCILLMRLAQESEVYSNSVIPRQLDEILSGRSDSAIFNEQSKLSAVEQMELAQLVIAQNLGTEQTILLLWGVRRGGRNHHLYVEAKAMLDRLISGLKLESEAYPCSEMSQEFDKVLSEQYDAIVFDEQSKLSIDEKMELARFVITQNLGIEKTIFRLWGIKSGGAKHYQYAEARKYFDRLIEQINNG